jgi:predicted membrane channel-forming protein YqfA (hemolysin III family)
MRPASFLSFAGFVILIAATYCPLFRPFGITTWDMYDGNKPYGIVVLLVAVVGIIGIVFMQIKIARMAAWLSVILVILFYFLALLKIHTSFSFIPFHAISRFFARQIKFKWGWWLLVAGPVLALLGAKIEKLRFKIPNQPQAVNNMDKQEL